LSGSAKVVRQFHETFIKRIMKRNLIQMGLFAAFCGLTNLTAQQMPEMPKPLKEHEWLKKFEGEWVSTSEMTMPGAPEPMKCSGTENAKMLGGFWVVCRGSGEMMGTTMSYSMTLGYDAAKKRYVGTMIDSMMPKMWQYEGSLDESGKILTLETTGPCPMRGGAMTDFKEIVEFKSDTHRTFTSMFKDEKGEWVTVFKGEAKKNN
jgi:hypothetical protein